METIRHKNRNTSFKVFVGGVLLVFGFVTLDMYFGYLLIVICVLILTYQSGVHIDPIKNRVRLYWSILGNKSGSWKSMQNFNTISIKKHRKGIRQYGTGLTSIDTSDLYYDVLLINIRNLKINVCLHSTQIKEEAKEQASSWCEKLNLPYKHYRSKV